VLRSSRVVLPLLIAPLFVGACALPPAVTIASLAADGVSYMATGKTVTDHGISAATANDCALMRPIFVGKPICRIDADRGKHVPVEVGQAAVPRPLERVAAVASVPVETVKDRYVRVGSFRDRGNAQREAARYAALNGAVLTVDAYGVHYYRVMVGPLSAGEETALKARLATEASIARHAG
jgi:hypothetical protein